MRLLIWIVANFFNSPAHLVLYFFVYAHIKNIVVCPCRMMWPGAPGKKTDNVNDLLVPGERAWKIKLPQFKNPIGIVILKIAGYIWRHNLASTMQFIDTNDKMALGWIRWQDFKCPIIILPSNGFLLTFGKIGLVWKKNLQNDGPFPYVLSNARVTSSRKAVP